MILSISAFSETLTVSYWMSIECAGARTLHQNNPTTGLDRIDKKAMN